MNIIHASRQVTWFVHKTPLLMDLELDTTNQDYKADSYKAASHYSYYYCNCFSVSHK